MALTTTVVLVNREAAARGVDQLAWTVRQFLGGRLDARREAYLKPSITAVLTTPIAGDAIVLSPGLKLRRSRPKRFPRRRKVYPSMLVIGVSRMVLFHHFFSG
jgi:hypothetical protein